jgi:hypothetical protein
MPGLSVAEKWVFARTLPITPDERWQMLQNFLRSLGLSTRSAQKRRGLLDRNDLGHSPLINQAIRIHKRHPRRKERAESRRSEH